MPAGRIERPTPQTPRTAHRRVLAPVFAAAVLASTPLQTDSLRAGAAAPAACAADARRANLNFTLPALDGRRVKLSDYRGRVLLLDFWATWCAPCQVEIPWLVEFQERYRSDGLAVVGVSVDDRRESLLPFVRDMKINYTVLQGRGQDRLLDAYRVDRVPTAVLISRDGRICASYAGDKTRTAVEDAIRSLLAQGPA
jgi:cytochrome c biogenesis protein CcmG/thiol:disulfide interchange protein DsbE